MAKRAEGREIAFVCFFALSLSLALVCFVPRVLQSAYTSAFSLSLSLSSHNYSHKLYLRDRGTAAAAAARGCAAEYWRFGLYALLYFSLAISGNPEIKFIYWSTLRAEISTYFVMLFQCVSAETHFCSINIFQDNRCARARGRLSVSVIMSNITRSPN